MNRRALNISLAAAFLSACASYAPDRGPMKVPPGKMYPGSYINVTAPKSEGWYLVGSSGRGMAFARPGTAPGETFAARVSMFPIKPTRSTEEFEALIVEQSTRDANTQRFSTTELSHSYSDARGYPCVEMHNVAIDRESQMGGGKTAALILENEHLYCRHPVQTDTGFVITYSYRGRARYPQLKTEARSFIEGIQVPDVSAR